MTLMSDAACNASLAMRYGAAKGSSAPDNLEFALYAGDPRGDGVEMDLVGGYAPVTAANNGTTWPDAPAGRAIVSAAQAWTPTGVPQPEGTPPTDPWTADGSPAAVTHWLIRDADTGDEWDSMPIDEPITVLDSDDAFSLEFVVNYVPSVAVS